MQTSLSPSGCRAFLGCQVEKAVDELNLAKNIISCHPSSLPLPDHVDRFVTLNRRRAFLDSRQGFQCIGSVSDLLDSGRNYIFITCAESLNSTPTQASRVARLL